MPGAESVSRLGAAEQTAEEAELVRQFALEAVELLSQGPESGMLLAKFNPAYQQHFDRKLRVSRYGFNKLIQLLQAIPDLVEVSSFPHLFRSSREPHCLVSLGRQSMCCRESLGYVRYFVTTDLGQPSGKGDRFAVAATSL